MRPNNRQRSRGGRNGGGGGGAAAITTSAAPQSQSSPNRNQPSTAGTDVRVRGNATRCSTNSGAGPRGGDVGRPHPAEAYWQYADHYFRMIRRWAASPAQQPGLGRCGEEASRRLSSRVRAGSLNRPTPMGTPRANAGRPRGASRAEWRCRARSGRVAFLQGGRSAPTDTDNDPAADEQPRYRSHARHGRAAEPAAQAFE